MSSIFGYFDKETEFPTFDPGMNTPCPYCMRLLERPVKTISLMKPGDARSYFYRAHKKCHEYATPQEIQWFESTLIDSLPPESSNE